MSKRKTRVGKDIDATRKAAELVLQYLAEWGIESILDVDPMTALDIIACHGDGWERGLAAVAYCKEIDRCKVIDR